MSGMYLQPRAPSQRGSDRSDNVSEMSDSGNSGWTSSRWDSREDLNSVASKFGVENPAALYQERFRVDRKKLEEMITGSARDVLPADMFFEQIMDDTYTYIAWPSKLKIDAKTKKDPHVRVIGRSSEDVKLARNRILHHLSSKENRVIMKIDVSHTEHSHIIGKGGESIRRVMNETQCHVHFPDSNRTNMVEKSNQVSISGSVDCVELARSRVRQKIPVVYGFEIPLLSQQNGDTPSAFIETIEEKYNVHVRFSQRPKLNHTFVTVKGFEWEVEQVKTATLVLIQYLCHSLASQTQVQMWMSISIQNQAFVAGKDFDYIKQIMRFTNAQIMFPDPTDPNISHLKKTHVLISGNINNVYTARQLIIGALPVTLMFDLPETMEIHQLMLYEIQKKYNVTITTRIKAKQNTRMFTLRAAERYATNLYKARNELLSLDYPNVIADIPNEYFFPTLNNNNNNNNNYEPPTPTPSNPQPMSQFVNQIFSKSWQSPPTFGSPFTPPPMVPPFFNNIPKSNHHQSTFQQTSSSGYQSIGSSVTAYPEHARESSFSLSNNSISSSTDSHFGSGGAMAHFSSMGHCIDEKDSDDAASPTDDVFRMYESKRLAAFKALQKPPSADKFRFPTDEWAGYGLSASLNQSNAFDEEIWMTSSPKRPLSPPPGLSTSNLLENTPTNVINRITSTDSQDVSTLLISIGLDKYVRLFRLHEIDMKAFLSLTEADLRVIGVKAFGARRKILLSISEMNKRDGMFLVAPGAERGPNTK